MSQESHRNPQFQETPLTQVVTEEKTAVQEPPLYKVYLVNDDFTPMDFVVWVLENIYHHPSAASVRIMLEVHQRGQGLCGVFPYDVARTKVYQTQEVARKEGHPLECIMEPDHSGSSKKNFENRRTA
ncbi:MAG: ATP-dependent Clp protease adapter ClpS [Deltaproteobacteria bacterium]|nr:MAG: ATP-dependent Clp protease adapter ClpS [Deltaproteobacteria bacterium]